MSETLYLATEKNVKVTGESVALGEIARLTCADLHVLARAKALKVMRIPAGQYGRYVVTAVTLIELVQRHLENVEVTHLGAVSYTHLSCAGRCSGGSGSFPAGRNGGSRSFPAG